MPPVPFALALLDFLAWLFDASPFVTRGHCGGPDAWPAWMRAVNVVSNVAIGLAYFGIPLCLGILWRHRRNNPIGGSWILVCFMAFISLCGTTHLADAVVFRWAPYRLYTLLDLATAGVSIATLALLPRVVLHVLHLPPHALVHRLNSELRTKVDELALDHAQDELIKAELSSKVEFLTRMVENDAWMHDKHSALSELRSVLASVGRIGNGGNGGKAYMFETPGQGPKD